MSLDLDAIKRRHLDVKRVEGRTFYLGHVEVDLAACVDEIEHLREELHAARAEIAAHLRRKAGCYAPSLWYAALTEAAAEIEQGKVGIKATANAKLP